MSELAPIDFKEETTRTVVASKLFKDGDGNNPIRGLLTAQLVGERDREGFNAGFHIGSFLDSATRDEDEIDTIHEQIHEGYNEARMIVNGYVAAVRRECTEKLVVAGNNAFYLGLAAVQAIAAEVIWETNRAASATMAVCSVATLAVNALGWRNDKKRMADARNERGHQTKRVKELVGTAEPLTFEEADQTVDPAD